MMIKIRHILILTCMCLTHAHSAIAQQNSLPDTESNNNFFSSNETFEIDRPSFLEKESEIRYSPRIANTHPKDSGIVRSPIVQPVVVQPKLKPEVTHKTQESLPKQVQPIQEKPSKAEDDSILSFNFLYYIIEKYKLQDIID